MPTLKEAYEGSNRVLDTAEKLTVAILERVAPQAGLGDAWGENAAEAFITCYNKIAKMEL